MRRLTVLVVLLAALLLSGSAEAQSCNGCGIGYTPPAPFTFTSSGAVSASGPILIPSGTRTAPGIGFATTPGTGFYLHASGFLTTSDSVTLAGQVGGVASWALDTGNILYGLAMRSDSYIRFSASNNALGAGGLFISRPADAQMQLGVDAATATAQTIKGPNSTGTDITGANLTLRGGAGSTGNATGGNLVLGGGVNAGTGERGAVLIEDGGTKPTCAAGIRGAIWYDAGGAGVLDTLEICRKDASNNYAWVGLF